MAVEPKSRRRHRKKVIRKNNGSLFDATERRKISAEELRAYVRDGGLFEARRKESGDDCTYEVLQEIMGMGLLQSLIPGLGSGGLGGGLGALTGLGGGGGPIAALGGPAGVANLLRALNDSSSSDGDWDDWDEPPRRSKSRSDDGSWAEADWAEGGRDKPRRARRSGSPDWASE